MKRRILVKVESTQSAYDFKDVDVTTLGEVKQLLRDKGVEIDDEHTEWHCAQTIDAVYKADATPLPSNVPWKGELTNDLIFKVVATVDKIKLGASQYDRKELYKTVKEYNLEDDVKNRFHKNFTQVSSDDLYNFINEVVDRESNDEYEQQEEEYDEECDEPSVEENLRCFISHYYLSEEAINEIMDYIKSLGLIPENAAAKDSNRELLDEIDDAFNF